MTWSWFQRSSMPILENFGAGLAFFVNFLTTKGKEGLQEEEEDLMSHYDLGWEK